MELKKILEDVKNNELDIDSALEILKDLPYEDLGYAHIDHHRSIRNGYPEVIYCKGKSDEHILGIIDRMNKKNTNILGTRCRKETFEKVKRLYPSSEYEEISKILKILIEESNNKLKGILKQILSDIEKGKTIKEREVVTIYISRGADYIIPSSNNQYIKASELKGMSKKELTLALNEIYARYGLMFNTTSIQQYFNSKDWYVPSINPGHFDDSQFNDYERHNVDTIVNYMKEKGYR